MLLNPKDGISIGFDSIGPAHTGQANMAKIKPEDITPLKHLSDVRYLLWERKCKLAGVPASSLKYHLASNIKDADTRDAVREVLGGFLMTKLPKWPGWPGVVITEQEREVQFTCLLGTPIGLAMGRFLAQRKDTMGNDRKIASIRLWQGVTRDIAQRLNTAHLCTHCLSFQIPYSTRRRQKPLEPAKVHKKQGIMLCLAGAKAGLWAKGRKNKLPLPLHQQQVEKTLRSH